MSDIIAHIAEAKIREAIKNGEFDNLPGSGKPLKLDDLSRVPQHMRAAFILMKNSGFLPEEVRVKKTIYSLRQLLKESVDDDERAELKRELLKEQLVYDILVERGLRSSRR